MLESHLQKWIISQQTSQATTRLMTPVTSPSEVGVISGQALTPSSSILQRNLVPGLLSSPILHQVPLPLPPHGTPSTCYLQPRLCALSHTVPLSELPSSLWIPGTLSPRCLLPSLRGLLHPILSKAGSKTFLWGRASSHFPVEMWRSLPRNT